jgi:hypothetical protein
MKKFLLLVLAFALIALPMVMAGITGRVEDPIPEFTTIGAGIAVIGAGIAYSLIRKKK